MSPRLCRTVHVDLDIRLYYDAPREFLTQWTGFGATGLGFDIVNIGDYCRCDIGRLYTVRLLPATVPCR
jgi:hypothetical protein